MATVLVGGAVLLVVGLIVWKMARDKKSGKGACGCDCAGCKGC